MQKPKPSGTPQAFYFTTWDIGNFSLPGTFLKLPIEKWNDLNQLVNTHLSLNKRLTEQQSLTKWIRDFQSVEAKYTRKPDVAGFARKLSNYLEDEAGRTEYYKAWEASTNKSKGDENDEKQEAASNAVRKKVRLIETLKLEKELHQEIDQLQRPSETAHTQSSTISISNSKTATKEPIPILKKIFTEGDKLHKKYTTGSELTPGEKKRMSSGLSGILDLAGEGKDSQSNLFSLEEWKRIKRYYLNKFKLKINQVSASLEEKWSYIYAKCSNDGAALGGRKYLDKLCSTRGIRDKDYNIFKLLEAILDIQQNCQHILNPLYPNKLVEGDYTYSIWLPVFTKLFNINQNLVRLKSAESVQSDSTNEKVLAYGDNHSNLVGFKVDIRFIYDFNDQEFDLCNMEVSRSKPSEEKVFGDAGKLFREGKTNSSSLFHVIGTDGPVHTWIIQVSGLKAYFSTVQYVGNNLFVVVPQFNISFPTCLAQLAFFMNDIGKLFTFQEDVELLAHAAAAKLEVVRDNRNSSNLNRLYNRVSSPSPPRHSTTTPSTVNWFTPPRNIASESIIPAINMQLLSEASDTELDSDDDENDKGTEVEEDNDSDNDSDDSNDGFTLTKKGWFVN